MLKKWGKNFKEELASTSGLVGGIGGATGLAATMLTAPYIAGVGFALTGLSFLYSGIKAIPKALENPEVYLNEAISIYKLNEIKPILKLGIIGESKVGKTTLLEKMRFKASAAERTDEITAHILSVNNSSDYVALIDGAGQEMVQQFTIIENVNVLIILLDHNNEKTSRLGKNRLEKQKVFLTQVIKHINFKEENKRVHFLLNKRDEWEKGSKTNELLRWYDSIKQEYINNPLIKVTDAVHSNLIINDIGNVWNIITKEVEDAKK